MNAAVIALDSVRKARNPSHQGPRPVAHEAQTMETIGRFASGIVHDFNNVLAAIGVNADMIVRQAQDAQQKQCAERMVAATMRGRDLVGQLLAYARSEAANLEPTDACASTARATDMIRSLAGAGISLESS